MILPTSPPYSSTWNRIADSSLSQLIICTVTFIIALNVCCSYFWTEREVDKSISYSLNMERDKVNCASLPWARTPGPLQHGSADNWICEISVLSSSPNGRSRKSVILWSSSVLAMGFAYRHLGMANVAATRKEHDTDWLFALPDWQFNTLC
jgi:hypothetical protein